MKPAAIIIIVVLATCTQCPASACEYTEPEPIEVKTPKGL